MIRTSGRRAESGMRGPVRGVAVREVPVREVPVREVPVRMGWIGGTPCSGRAFRSHAPGVTLRDGERAASRRERHTPTASPADGGQAEAAPILADPPAG